ncbi:hypothetical protein yc1106_09744 [Curvularia clavata]|uniref:BRCT domain-containing protein n=1 Tax=Curvularia clavata TaxID=95742 RepID=A0A9Q8ZHU6_CURCL|nr:hypothetical protein yc1106_09744 [Curvularia clavata]
MVATRRGAKEAPAASSAPSNTLKAAPKRGARTKAVDEPATESAPAKITKTTATKRKAKDEPEDAELPAAKKTAATKTTRTTKIQTKAEPTPAAPKRATRGRKADEVEPAEEAPKPATTRARKIAPVKKASAPKVEEPAAPEESFIDELSIEEDPKPTSRPRKAIVKKAPVTKKTDAAVVKENVAVETAKPATRARKPPVPKAPAAASRATRGRDAPTVTQEPVIKTLPRKPIKKVASKAVAKVEPQQIEQAAEETVKTPGKDLCDKTVEPVVEPEPVEEPMAEYPEYPSTPAHITAPINSRKALAELPNYPNTPSHIVAPLSNKAALAELAEYPNTPAHIVAPISSKDALAQMPGYPKTPAHIKAPISNEAALAEMPSYPKTPAHIKAPISSVEALAEMPEYPKTPAHISAPISNKDALTQMPGYPKTPAHIKAPISNTDAMAEMPNYPTTPARIVAPVASPKEQKDTQVVDHDGDIEMSDVEESSSHQDDEVSHNDEPESLITTSAQEELQETATPVAVDQEEVEDIIDSVETAATPAAKSPVPVQAQTPYHATTPLQETSVVVPGTPPTQIVWGVTDQEAFEELPAEYPTTPSHITAPVTSKAAMAELPDYPKTPAHIRAPITPRRAFAELPDYPTTPSLALEAAIQEEITASVKKQTPSPVRYPSVNRTVSFGLDEPSEIADMSEITEASEFSEVHVVSTPKAASFGDLKASMPIKPLQLAPTFAAPQPASPTKSALRSPLKVTDAKTPKKSVAWTDIQADESELNFYDGILQGMVFYVDVTRNGKEQNFLFRGLLEDLGAKVVTDISHSSVTHVLFKDGSMSTLEKCFASKGAIKCVNVGWVLDSEANKKRMDEDSYLVDLSVARPASPLPTATMKPFTPAKTPSKYALPPSSQCKTPSTPTSSEFDRSFDADKENCEVGAFFDKSPLAPRTVPNKKSTFLFGQSAIKTPSRPLFHLTTPSKLSFSAVKPAPQAFSTVKKRPTSSLFNSSLGPPRKLRLF